MIALVRRRDSRPLVRAAVLGVLAAGAIFLAPPCAPAAAPPTVELRVKLTDSAVVASLADAGPLFTRPGITGGLARWYRVEVAADRAAETLAALRARPDVVTAFVAPDLSLPSPEIAAPSCPIRTPAYDPLQGYLGAAPAGIDVPTAWRRPGGRGEGVWFADIEGGWNAGHEDLPTERIVHVIGTPQRDAAWQGHGTAVLGEVVGRDNGLGVVGIAPDVARVVTASVFGVNLPDALDHAQAALRPGDVLLIELQSTGPRGRYVPVELWDDVFEAIQVATARGVVVVEAAGNGGEDLDHPIYQGAFDRAVRDSGAILVGAGAPARPGWADRSRLDFSNYGSRVDVQGWGRRVTTLDYGDLQRCDGRDRGRHYTDEFAGTSSASPIVAGAAILVEGVYRAAHGVPMPPRELRRLLTETGTPQTDGPHGPATQHIGPRPDLARALGTLEPQDAGSRDSVQ